MYDTKTNHREDIMTRRQEIIKKFAQEFVVHYDRACLARVQGFMSLAYEFDFIRDKEYPGLLKYSRIRLEKAVLRRVKELLEDREVAEKKRPHLVTVVTGEHYVGPAGMSEDNYFEMLFA